MIKSRAAVAFGPNEPLKIVEIIVTTQVQQTVDQVQDHLLGWETPHLTGHPHRGVSPDDHFATDPPPRPSTCIDRSRPGFETVTFEWKGEHIGRTVDLKEIRMQPRHLEIVDNRHTDLGVFDPLVPKQVASFYQITNLFILNDFWERMKLNFYLLTHIRAYKSR